MNVNITLNLPTIIVKPFKRQYVYGLFGVAVKMKSIQCLSVGIYSIKHMFAKGNNNYHVIDTSVFLKYINVWLYLTIGNYYLAPSFLFYYLNIKSMLRTVTGSTEIRFVVKLMSHQAHMLTEINLID